MPFLLYSFVPGSQLTSTVATYYSHNANSGKGNVVCISFCNSGSTSAFVELYFVQAGGAPDNSNRFVANLEIKPNSPPKQITLAKILSSTNDSIQARVISGGPVSLFVDGFLR